MVDANTVEDAFLNPLQNEGMGLFEDVLTFDAEADEGVDIEEAAITELLIRGLPVGDAEMLALEEIIERVDVPVQLPDSAVDAGARARVFAA
jgi:hypothetical protein